MTGTSGIAWRDEPMCLDAVQLLDLGRLEPFRVTYVCKVTPRDRKSCTRSTLDMALRPKSSKHRTFQMGSPSAVRMEAGARGLLGSSDSGASSLRLRIFLKAASMDLVALPDCLGGLQADQPICRSRRVLPFDAMMDVVGELDYARVA